VFFAWSLAAVVSGCGGSDPAPPRASTIERSPGTSQPAAVEPAESDVETPQPITEPMRARIEEPSAAPLPVYRPNDLRPKHDDARLEALGIHVWESKRLKLYGDLPEEQGAVLPPLVDQLYDALEAEFGALPPARDGGDFQMTGYLIRDDALFRETGLIPDNLPPLNHGRHRANEFWLRDQEFDYYRAHLLLHEATHAFMTFMPDTQSPVWYLEGMAEVFGTHRALPDGRIEFGVMPDRPEAYAGWGRITLVRREFAADRVRQIPEIIGWGPEDFFQPESYAWCWSLAHFLRQHPRYRARFQALGREDRGTRFAARFRELFGPDTADLSTEWALYITNLQYGYDVARAAIEFQPGQPLAVQATATVDIHADRGWQSSRVEVVAGETYRITATGQVTLANEPRPWVSEPRGVTIDYVDGQPLGKLLAAIRSTAPSPVETMLRVLPVGPAATFTAPLTGTVYLRVNDGWDRLADNRGAYRVTIEHPSPSADRR
jgi:hypothetical protein